MQGENGPATKKRRRQRRKDARPGEIIDSAMTLWAEKGFAATRLDDIAADAGVAKGTIYRYFDSKEDLFEKAVETRLVATMNSIGAQGASFEGTTEDLLRQVFDVMLSQMADQKGYVFIKVLISEGHRFPELVARYRTIALARGMQVIQGILARGVARGELHSQAGSTDPRLVVGPVILATLWDVVFNMNSAGDRATFIDNHVALLMRGLRPTSGEAPDAR